MKTFLSFLIVTALVFMGLNLLSFGYFCTGPHQDFDFYWLRLHSDGASWSVEAFNFCNVLTEILFASALTWILSEILHRRANHKFEI